MSNSRNSSVSESQSSIVLSSSLRNTPMRSTKPFTNLSAPKTRTVAKILHCTARNVSHVAEREHINTIRHGSRVLYERGGINEAARLNGWDLRIFFTFSGSKYLKQSAIWRKRRDSNPRDSLTRLPHFECGAFDHSATFPNTIISNISVLSNTFIH